MLFPVPILTQVQKQRERRQTIEKTVETHFFGVEPLFFEVEPPLCGIEWANFAGEPEDQHPHPGMVAVMGEMLAVPCFLVWLRGLGQKKDRNGQKRVHLHALHGHVKKPSDIEANISLANIEAYCCICIYIFGFGILCYGAALASSLSEPFFQSKTEEAAPRQEIVFVKTNKTTGLSQRLFFKVGFGRI